MPTAKIILLAFGMLLGVSNVFCRPKDAKAQITSAIQSKYERLEAMPTETLYALGDKFYKKHHLNTAMECYSVVSNRYKKTMDKAEKYLCAKAYYRCGTLFTSRYNDYAKALQNFQSALDIVNDEHFDDLKPSILIHIGNIYVFYADQHNSIDMMRKGFEMYRNAMFLAQKRKQWENLTIAFCNIISCRPEYATKLNIYEDVRYFKSLTIDKTLPYYTYLRLMADGMAFMEKRNYTKAINLFELSNKQIKKMGNAKSRLRYQFNAECHIAECYTFLGYTHKALVRLHSMERQAAALHLVDLMPEIYSRLEILYRQIGDMGNAQTYRLKHLEAKDSLLNGMGVEGVKDIHFLHELNALNAQLAETTYQRERQRIFIVVCFIVIVLILIFLSTIYKKNRQLDANNKVLYQRIQETLQYHTEKTRNNVTVSSAGAATRRGNMANLSDSQMKDVIQRLEVQLAKMEILCSPDLTEQTLAKLLGTNSAYLSKAINELCKCNFSSYINNLRIMEACKRLNDKEHYGKLSIEGIGISVGFKSRSTFTTTFKRITGLTPSEYQREACKNV